MRTTLAVGQVDVGDTVTDWWRSFLDVLPRAIAFVAILVVGWLVARAVLRVVDGVLERVGFDRAVERGGVGRALERTRYDASDILARLAYYTVLLFTLQFAFGIWGPNAISNLINSVVRWLPQAFIAIVIVVVASAIAKAARDLVRGALGGLSYGKILADVIGVFIVALGVIAALNQVGIATTVTTPVLITVLATIAGILIIGVGGGLVRPMQQRWEDWLNRAEQETRAARERDRGFAAGRGDMDRQMADRAGAGRGGAEQPTMAGGGQSGVYRSGNPSEPGGGGAQTSPR